MIDALFLFLGASSLYRGLSPALLRTIPATAALFIVVEWTRKMADTLFAPPDLRSIL